MISRIIISFTLMLASLAATSCSLKPKEINSIEDIQAINGKLSKTKATVFIHNPRYETANATILHNGKKVVTLDGFRFTKMEIPPGISTFSAEWDGIRNRKCEGLTLIFLKDTIYHISLKNGPSPYNFGLADNLSSAVLMNRAHFANIHPMSGFNQSRYERYVKIQKSNKTVDSTR